MEDLTKLESGELVPIPSNDTLQAALSLDQEIVACSAKRFGPQIALRLAFRNANSESYAVSTSGGLFLLRALKGLIADGPSIGAASVTDGAVQEGRVP